MAPSDANTTLLSRSDRTESPEPLSPRHTPLTPPPRPPGPSRRHIDRQSRADYAYSSLEAYPRTPSPDRGTANPLGDNASHLTVPGPPTRTSTFVSKDNEGSEYDPFIPDATPEDAHDALTRPLAKQPKDVDIIMYTFQDDISIGPGKQVKKLDDLKSILEDKASSQASPKDFLLLIEDISPDVVKFLGDFLDFNPNTAAEHVKGRVNDEDGFEKKRSGLHVDKIQTTLFDHISRRENQESLTWWKLFSHSRTGYTREKEALDGSSADLRKMTVPHFEVHISDTFKKTTSDDIDNRVKGVSALVRSQWQRQREQAHQRPKVKPEGGHIIDPVAPKPDLELRSRKVHRLDAKTYRPHQVITEVKKGNWGAAAEERITFTRLYRDGSNYYILLFDKPRGIREYTQRIHIKDQEDHSGGLLSHILAHDGPSEVIVKSDTPGDVFSTFLSDKPATVKRRREKRRVRSPVRKLSMLTSVGEEQEEKPLQPLPTSTRERFIAHAGSEGLFDRQPSAIEGQDAVVRKAKLIFSALVAEDWNLVLSQMSLTLDEIDTNMSDNIMLQENALAWRRLLCSWRVSLVEYATRLEESKQLLRAQISIRPQPSTSTLVPSPSSSAGVSRKPTPTSVENAANRSFEDAQSILYRYQILADGVSKIEQRVDRSFQAIMSSMSIIESERAITQGVAIARLTELAFIFIPLSFAAAFFSMQVQDFEGSGQPRLRHFFAMGIVLIFSMYCLRAFLRSSMLAKFVRNMERRIRESSRVPGTEEIPARVVMSFAWQQLGVLTRTLLLVVPFFIVALVLITTLSYHTPFKAVGSVLLVIGTFMILGYVFIRRYLASFRTAIILVWMLSLLGAGLGGETTPNPAIMGTICTIVTTVCVVALAVIPQNYSSEPETLALQILTPLWVLELPIAILCHYYQIKKWEPWQLSIGIMPFVTLFGIFSSWLYRPSLRWLPQALGIGALFAGIPLSLVWSYWPLRHATAPLYGQLLVTAFSVAVFAWMLCETFPQMDFLEGMPPYLIVFVAIPLIMTWSYSPSHGNKLPLYGQLLVTFVSLAAVSWIPFLFLKSDSRKKKAWLGTFACAFIGVPMVLVWCYDPSHGNKFPLYAKLIVTIASVVVCSAAYQITIHGHLTEHSTFLVLFLCLVGVPNIVVWALLPHIGRALPLYARICVTFGSVVVLCLVVRLMKPFSEDPDWKAASWVAAGMALAGWIPTIVWTVDTKAMEPIRRSRATMIHVTWTTILFWVIVWPLVWRSYFSSRASSRLGGGTLT